MMTVKREHYLNVSISQVWQLIQSVAQLPKWFAFAENATLLEGSGQGRHQQISGHWGSQPMEIDQIVTDYEPQRVLAWQHIAERLDGKPAPKLARSTKFTIRLHTQGNDTHIQIESQQEPAGLLPSLMIRLFGARHVGKMLDRSLKDLDTLSTVGG